MDILEKNNEEISKSNIRVQFQEQRAPRYSSETPKIIQWVIKYSDGLVKDKKQATYVLLGFVAVAIIISLFLLFGGGGVKKGPKLPPSLPTPISLYEKQ